MLFLRSFRVYWAMIKNVKHIMNKTDCCPNYPNSEAVNSSFNLEKNACFEVLDFLEDYKKLFVCFYSMSVDFHVPVWWFYESYRHV